MNSGPLTSIHQLDMDPDVKYSQTKYIKPEQEIGLSYGQVPEVEYNNIVGDSNDNPSYFKNKRGAAMDQKPPKQSKRSYSSKSSSDLRSARYKSLENDTNEVFIRPKLSTIDNAQDYEIKANGMMKIKRKKKEVEQNAYMSKRLKNQPSMNSSSGSLKFKKMTPLDMLHQHDKHFPNVKMQGGGPNMVIKNPTSSLLKAPSTYSQPSRHIQNKLSKDVYEEEFKNLPSPAIASSKYKNSAIGFKSKWFMRII